jgi:hypothetical protein
MKPYFSTFVFISFLSLSSGKLAPTSASYAPITTQSRPGPAQDWACEWLGIGCPVTASLRQLPLVLQTDI